MEKRSGSFTNSAENLPVKSKWSEELIQKTIKVWAPKMGRDPTREEAIEMLDKVTGYFRVLIEWDAAERKKEAEEIE